MPIAKYLSSSLVLAALLAVSGAANAEEAPTPAPTTVMGRPGTVVLDRLLGVGGAPAQLGGAIGFFQAGPLGFSHAASSAPGSEASSTALDVRPSFDVFLSQRLTLGGEASFVVQWSTTEGAGGSGKSTAYLLSALPRIGYYLPLSDSVAFWPRVSVGGSYARTTRDSAALGANADSVAFRTNVDLDLAVALTKHLALLAGPRLSATIAGAVTGDDSRSTSVTASVRGSLSYAF